MQFIHRCYSQFNGASADEDMRNMIAGILRNKTKDVIIGDGSCSQKIHAPMQCLVFYRITYHVKSKIQNPVPAQFP